MSRIEFSCHAMGGTVSFLRQLRLFSRGIQEADGKTMHPDPEQHTGRVHHQVARAEKSGGKQDLEAFVQDPIGHGDG